MPGLLFYFFSGLLLSAALCVVMLKSPVRAVMCLVVCFLAASALMIMTGAEYVGMSIIIVYAGAVAILFLFIVMLLQNSNIRRNSDRSFYLALFCLIGLVAPLVTFVLLSSQSENDFIENNTIEIAQDMDPQDFPEEINISTIGITIYTKYILQVQMVALILLSALISSVMLLSAPAYRKRQRRREQIMRSAINSLSLIQVQSGKGIKL